MTGFTPPPGVQDPGDPERFADQEVQGGPWSEHELNELLDTALHENRVPPGDDVQLTPELSLSFVVLDNRQTGEVNYQIRNADIFTRENWLPRQMLSRAIRTINGRPINDQMLLEKWLGRMPQAVLNAIFDRYMATVNMQVNRMSVLADLAKKGQPSLSSESDGGSPSTSGAGRGTSE